MKKKTQLKLYNIKIILSVVFIFSVIVNILIVNTGNFQGSIDNKNNYMLPKPSAQPIIPKKLGVYYNESGISQDVFISGDIAYIADGPDGLEIVNISNPSSSNRLGGIDNGGTSGSQSIFVSGDYAYLGNYGNNLRILNISDPTKPVEIGYFDDTSVGVPEALYVSGGIAYIAHRWIGLRIVNVSDPTDTFEIGRYYGAGTNELYDVFILGTIAYIADHDEGLKIIDISDPRHPKKIGGYYDANHSSYGLCISENIAYLADYYGGLKIIDVSDPKNTVSLANYSVRAMDVCISGNIAYVATYDEGLKILDISTPSNPTELGTYDDGGWFYYGLFYSQNKVYVAASADGMVIIGVSFIEGRWSNPSYLGSLTGIGNARGFDIWNNTVYLCDGNEGLRIIDITDPTSPEEIAYYNNSHKMYNVIVSNNLAYATEYAKERLVIINVTDPLNTTGSFREIGFYQEWLFGGYTDIEISGNLAYITNGKGLLIINITDPTYPRKVIHFLLESANSVDISGNYAYIGAEDQGYGLRIIDVTDPTNPFQIGYHDGGGNPRGVFVSNDIAYVADGLEGLEIIDVSNPHQPVEIESFETGTGVAVRVHVFGNLAFLADTYDGVEVIDITNPSQPSRLFHIPGDFTWYAYADSHHIYFVDDTNGFCIYNNGYSNPSTTNSDSDSLTDAEELFVYGTDPDDSDSDNDGLDDDDEIITYTTDPNNPDSDFDNMPDGWEINYNFNPKSSLDNVTDYDSDGLLNIYEYTNDTDPTDADSDDDDLSDYEEISTYTTDPNNPDSDYDDLPDGWEVSYSLDPKAANKNEDPDVDGLSNYEEFLHGTDPRLADTDGDGYTDGEEVEAGTDPLDPASFPYDVMDFFKDYGVLLGIAIISIAVVSAGAIRWKKVKSKRLLVFISHDMDDFESYRIAEIAEFLESKKEIAHVYFCEEHLVGHIDDWMKSTVPRCQLLIYFSTENSLESVDCLNEIRLARNNNIQIRPILGVNLQWEDLKKLNVDRDLGQEFTPMQFKEFCNKLYEYTKQIKEDIEKAVSKKVKEKKVKIN